MSTPEGVALVAMLSLFATAACAGWQDDATAFDRNRLANIDAARAKALAETHADIAQIRSMLDADMMPMSDNDLSGNWDCRTMTPGGRLAVSGWFDCRVTYKTDGLYFERLSGPQRMSGRLYAQEPGRYIFLGGASGEGEAMGHYSRAATNNVVGVLTITGLNHARVEFPYPDRDTNFAVIELKR